ncbi:MAG TPA: DUF4105 domain-containing protein [Gemmatimonadales bacterium]|nr:DUF4105 domain-containing protein [Gemmatimonadales bacterium]
MTALSVSLGGRGVAGLVVAIVAVGLAAWWRSLHPSNERSWSPDQAVMPRVSVTGDQVRIEGVRNFHWRSATEGDPAWESRTYPLDGVATVWYVLVPFSSVWRGPAHAFVSFGFDDGRYLAISIEARREAGERYGLIAGLLRRFELLYVVGDERDLIGRRAVYDGTDVFLFPVRADRAAVRALLVAMLRRAEDLRQHPEFYNTLTNNCTLNIVRQVNAVVPGTIPVSWRIVLPGYSDEVARRLGLIPGGADPAAGRERFRINQRARAALDAPDFSARIRQ